MKKTWAIAATLSAAAGAAQAGGLERSSQSVGILFEEGTYAELNFGTVDPTVSGSMVPGNVPSGDMLTNFNSFSLGYKQALNDKVDIAFILDQPIGADVAYPSGGFYPYEGGNADVNTLALTGLIKYRLPNNLSVYGGLRIQQADGELEIPLFSDYGLTADTVTDLGYVVGVAYEKPEIALRIALTYNSAIDHNLDDVEESLAGFTISAAPFEVTVPQSVNLEFQSGIAKNTLLFGSVRWVDWTAFDITPPFFANVVAPGAGLPVGTAIVDYGDDTFSYTLGVGRKFNENWSGAVILGYEEEQGGFTGNLGPTDGYKSIALAATYTHQNMEITGAIRYIDIGDATTFLGDPPVGEFTDNDALAIGVRIGYHF